MFFQPPLLSLRPPVSSSRRYASGTPKPSPPLGSRAAVSPAAEPPTERFRSPRVYTFRRIALATAIPAAIVYQVFFAKYDQEEHVFTPARRWLARQKAAFFALSPEERRMLERQAEVAASSRSEPSNSVPNSDTRVP
ncbi:hypothetical protein PUNSTDRAFT_141506 [Punctularia strigosozonata HHB-11173 SS5]|uniref:uncharacterized protein n=1 Tax=Punctularia strigosozonata (strain HHB-11173) TaxID=741275 RepID=UPI00044165B7|nr:uncharacterized protein PUNSTDRAFT_141506 [Punctularia strigosozonata HHB-11173 SS5]EIN12952.1 hypothetical protein PUNSTDRAFT_141506 [Punctularia strigosozonata HHB-11173 SS5]